MRYPTPEKLRARAKSHLAKALAIEAKKHRGYKWFENSEGWRKLADDDIAYADYLERMPDHLKPDWTTQ
jgi:hypothetical protein